MIDEDLAVEVGLGEAVAARIELLLVSARLESERIEIGMQVTADAIGANEHQRAHQIAGRLLDIGRGDFNALGLRLGLDLVADRPFDLAPVAVERGHQFAVAADRPVRLFPRRPAGVLMTSPRSSFRLWKNACHSASTELGSVS